MRSITRPRWFHGGTTVARQPLSEVARVCEVHPGPGAKLKKKENQKNAAFRVCFDSFRTLSEDANSTGGAASGEVCCQR